MKTNLAKLKPGRLCKGPLKNPVVLSFFYPSTDDSSQWLKTYYTLWTSFAGYSKSNFLVYDSFRKAKHSRNFSLALGFKSCKDALDFFEVLENPLENLKHLGFLNFSTQEVLWQMQKIKFLFFKAGDVYFSSQLLRKELSLRSSDLLLNLNSVIKKQLFYRICAIYSLILRFTQLFSSLFLLVLLNLLFVFRLGK